MTQVKLKKKSFSGKKRHHDCAENPPLVQRALKQDRVAKPSGAAQGQVRSPARQPTACAASAKQLRCACFLLCETQTVAE